MPLDVAVWSGPWIGRVYRYSTVCNLAWGKRVHAFYQFDETAIDHPSSPMMFALLPALSDIRSFMTNNRVSGDLLEIPEDSGRWYGVVAVDDMSKGFENEHRVAIISQVGFAASPQLYPDLKWPVPMP